MRQKATLGEQGECKQASAALWCQPELMVSAGGIPSCTKAQAHLTTSSQQFVVRNCSICLHTVAISCRSQASEDITDLICVCTAASKRRVNACTKYACLSLPHCPLSLSAGKTEYTGMLTATALGPAVSSAPLLLH